MRSNPVSIFLLLFICIYLTNCRTTLYTEHWNKQSPNDSLIIYPQIKDFINFIVRAPEDALDDFLFNIYSKSPLPKSSTVKIIIINDKDNNVNLHDRLACAANIKNDTLIIGNGVSGTDSGFGVRIKIIRYKIFISYYKYFDFGVHRHETPKLRIQKQTIQLDKANYLPRDSLFGSIYSRMIDENKVKYYISGYFRAKVGSYP